MPRKHANRDSKTHREPSADEAAAPPRIIGGRLRGRKLLYVPDLRTRPMKDRVREAVFNLIGPAIVGKHALDLFAGTGALGFEAISRGASGATFVERHFPTADLIRQNLQALELTDLATVLPANVLLWSRRLPPLPETPWVVFFSPPWELFVEQGAAVIALITTLLDQAPAGSILVVEADERFDFSQLPRADEWSIRPYPPAVIGIFRVDSKAAPSG